jgi:intein/homing endonuclease
MLADPFDKREKEIRYPVYSQPKLDGCLHEDTIVKTSLGDLKIKDVKVGMSVHTFNETTAKQELKSVVGVYKNGVDVNETKTEWFKITLESGQDITLTGNHRVWVDNLKCWRRVDELDGTEELKLFHQV